jgi:hypothetical protein
LYKVYLISFTPYAISYGFLELQWEWCYNQSSMCGACFYVFRVN